MSAPEQTDMIDSFKEAALSVTKLYRKSVAAQAKSRADGYQECLEDLNTFLDRENIGHEEGEGAKVRKWTSERLEGRDAQSQGTESEEETERADPASSPDRSSNTRLSPVGRSETGGHGPAAPTATASASDDNAMVDADDLPVPYADPFVVPTQDTFTFQSSHPFPYDAHMNIANLDISEGRVSPSGRATPSTAMSRSGSAGRSLGRNATRSSLGRGAGQKRKVNFNPADISDFFSLGHGGRDASGGGGKRSRHA